MEPSNELSRSRLWKTAFGGHGVDLFLHADMSGCFELEISACTIGVKLPGQGTLDLARSRVVTLDEVAVVRVHQPDQVSEIGCRPGMQCSA